MKHSPSPAYLIWQKGSGDPRKPENWQTASPLEALSIMQAAFSKNLGRYARLYPDSPRDATSIWWGYLHRPGWSGVDLGRARVRRLDPP